MSRGIFNFISIDMLRLAFFYYFYFVVIVKTV